MSASSEDTASLLRAHLAAAGIADDPQSSPWTLGPSPLGGRGVFATRDIAAGELVFRDPPLVVGPRAGRHCPPVCVGCHGGPEGLVPCSRGCGLPVCSAPCEDAPHHRHECDRLRSWGRPGPPHDAWCPELLRAATPVRCLALGPLQRRVLACMQSNPGPQHAFEVDILKKHTTDGPGADEEAFMRLACCVMDANAFETAQIPKAHAQRPSGLERSLSGFTPSLRGLYPLAAMMNHACTPNTRHAYDRHHVMVVRATVPIPAGTEVTNSYTSLLWGTPARRHHLALTKHFQCACPRCADPQEGGALLAALKCSTPACPGFILQLTPLDEESDWACLQCGRMVTGRHGALTQATLGRLLGIVDCKDADQMERFLREHHLVAPPSNQIVVEVKCCLVRAYGHGDDLSWTDLTEEQLQRKESLCRELLQLLVFLGAGQCRMKGLLLYELHCTLMEMLHRRNENTNTNNDIQKCAKEALSTIEEAVEILGEDVSAPLDLMTRQRVCRKNCE
ncbi:SET domain-containing protein SmydA-8 [Periplaneta americana]|uniref:SET domain-containing protein SmydA-8 n=1 Tax=Periplaneta americana TaxID=6978 RepID=UPI0037E897D9